MLAEKLRKEPVCTLFGEPNTWDYKSILANRSFTNEFLSKFDTSCSKNPNACSRPITIIICKEFTSRPTGTYPNRQGNSYCFCMLSLCDAFLGSCNMIHCFCTFWFETLNLADYYNESNTVVEFYPFKDCYPGFFGLNCEQRCHCESSCTCDPVVWCARCDEGKQRCHLLYQDFPTCQGEWQ